MEENYLKLAGRATGCFLFGGDGSAKRVSDPRIARRSLVPPTEELVQVGLLLLAPVIYE